MNVAEYIINEIAKLVDTVFVVSGGGNIHLIEALANHPKLKMVCMHHEQACAFAAEGYARIHGIGVIIVTTGPGSTNAITGVYSAFVDSIPMIVISGQVKTSNQCFGGMRQMGDQEIDIIPMVQSITKFAGEVNDVTKVEEYMYFAREIALRGRKGPTWLSVPLDIQSSPIEIEGGNDLNGDATPSDPDHFREIVFPALQNAKRPILIVGKGIRLAEYETKLRLLLDIFKIPVITSFTGMDLLPDDHPCYIGREGIIGQPWGNEAISKADLILTIGTRMNYRMTTFQPDQFAPKAVKIYTDIDQAEFKRPALKDWTKCTVKVFDALYVLEALAGKFEFQWTDWLTACKIAKVNGDQYKSKEQNWLDIYEFWSHLHEYLPKNATLVVSNGFQCIACYECYHVREGDRILINSGCASMGWALPSAIGAYYADPQRPVFCFEGDGSIMMNLGSLHTVKSLPITLFILNNYGYCSIKDTERNMFKRTYDNYVACQQDDTPSFGLVLEDGFGISTSYLARNRKLQIYKEDRCHAFVLIGNPEMTYRFKIASHFNKETNTWEQDSFDHMTEMKQ